MSEAVIAHPPSERLRDFGLGRLRDAELDEMGSHLSECSECRRVVEELPADSFVELLQESHNEARQEGLNKSEGPASQPGLYKRLAAILNPAAAAAPAPVRLTATLELPAALRGHPRYEVFELLGVGGMGTVYKARHRLMDRLVALKIMNPELLTKTTAGERFVRETKAAAQLLHPNIVTAYDAERIADMHFLVMEFVEGQTLARLVLERGPLPVHQACEYVRQAAHGLEHAASRQMVHRDIKPHNLILTPEGHVKILDFGLARFLSETGQPGTQTACGALMGSPDYMAPEQAKDPHTADIRADIYGLGCTLYHLLTGQVPFPGGTAVEKMSAHLERTPTPVAQLRPDVPEGVRAVLDRLLAKDAAERYQTPAEVADGLTPFCTPVPASAASRPVPPAPQRRLAASLVAPSLVTVLSLAVLLLGALGIYHALTPGGPVDAARQGSQEVATNTVRPNQAATITDEKPSKEPTSETADGQVAPKQYAWPADKLKEGKIPAPDFSKTKPLLDEDFTNPQKRLVGIERQTEPFGSAFENNRFVITYKWDKPLAFSTAPAANTNRPFAFQVTARAAGQLTDGWGITILTSKPKDRAVNIKIARDAAVRFDGWFLNPNFSDFPGRKPAPFSHKKIKPGDEDNTLLVLLQERHLEVYVNGVAVCDPLLLDQDMLPARLLIVARPDHKGAKAEFKRVTLWSAEGVPPLKTRGAVEK